MMALIYCVGMELMVSFDDNKIMLSKKQFYIIVITQLTAKANL